jgi:hypothetical protein
VAKSLESGGLLSLCAGKIFANSANGAEYDDLHDLIGTWKVDAAFDQALADQDAVDPDLWR